jgi:5-deoxy-glucuronate isomerase
VKPRPSHPWFVAAGQQTPPFEVHLDPGTSSLSWAGLRVVEIAAESSIEFNTGALEMCVLPLGGALRVEVGSESFRLSDRLSVFHGIADWAYVPTDAEVRISTTGGPATVAIPSALSDQRKSPAFIDGRSVPVELRGAGPATRQLNNFMAPEVFDGSHRLMCVEVITPDGNWSSYPPHRHDGVSDCPLLNEEIYYFRIGATAGDGSVSYSSEGFGMHRTYTVEGDVDVNVPVRDGDVFMIPRGYHGPCIAAPGYPMYYLNVLAGPTGERSMAFCDDPAHHWVRDTWSKMPQDPRLPMTSFDGPVNRPAAQSLALPTLRTGQS